MEKGTAEIKKIHTSLPGIHLRHSHRQIGQGCREPCRRRPSMAASSPSPMPTRPGRYPSCFLRGRPPGLAGSTHGALRLPASSSPSSPAAGSREAPQKLPRLVSTLSSLHARFSAGLRAPVQACFGENSDAGLHDVAPGSAGSAAQRQRMP
jgi:hypothetical protein